MAEGGGLLNRYRVKSSIGGSNPPLSARLFRFATYLRCCDVSSMSQPVRYDAFHFDREFPVNVACGP